MSFARRQYREDSSDMLAQKLRIQVEVLKRLGHLQQDIADERFWDESFNDAFGVYVQKGEDKHFHDILMSNEVQSMLVSSNEENVVNYIVRR